MFVSNTLGERVALRYNLKGQAPSYSQYDGTSTPSAAPKGTPGYGNLPVWTEADTGGYTGSGEPMKPDASKGDTPDLAETAMVQEEMQKLPPTQKCALGDGNFEDTTGRILKCGGCGAPCHESCLTFQITAEGTCKICGRILRY